MSDEFRRTTCPKCGAVLELDPDGGWCPECEEYWDNVDLDLEDDEDD